MLTGDELNVALAHLPVLTQSEVAYRIVHAKYALLCSIVVEIDLV
ncbi:hypothetical protein [Chroococcidiopsis thermalis]|uniref:Uncharacterized protein n=1 Tax=Chroococcidiopsis thermalis (strain PCC 7203) TaxID=251229 RepID=K9U8D4_CHRTP|nr:hypothetical protein [Chroococcidiopsis thermalis]AFY91105.1 hypothetical protein Chro_5764 [Chroococcidiopsis thermalis PCC 7203]